jgi:tetratricopeptide (TPR) repeat protein
MTTYYFNTMEYQKAKNSVEKGLLLWEKLVENTPDATAVVDFKSSILSNLLLQKVKIAFRLSDWEAAKSALDDASKINNVAWLMNYQLAYSVLAEKKGTEVLKLFFDQTPNMNEYSIALSLVEIEFLINTNPSKYAELRKFQSELKKQALKTESIDSLLIDFYYCDLKRTEFGLISNWDSAVVWTENLIVATESLIAKGLEDVWSDEHTTALLNHSYYLLFTGKNNPGAFKKSIASAEKALKSSKKYKDKKVYFSEEPLILTNLSHALYLNGQREEALKNYQEFLTKEVNQDPEEALLKDFRDLYRAGIVFPEMKMLLEKIFEGRNRIFSKEEFEAMGAF